MTLVIKNDGIGDLVLASGLIADIAQAKGPVDLITCAANREVAENIPGIRRLLLVSRDGIQFQRHLLRVGIRWLKMTIEDRLVLDHLAKTQYDTAICLRRFIRQSSLVMMQAVRAPRRYCTWLYPSNAPRSLATELSSGWDHYHGSEAGSELLYFRDFLRKKLQLDSLSPPRLRCAEGAQPAPEDGRIGLVIAGASTNWPAENWVLLARALVKEGKQLIIFGGPDARPLAARILASSPGVIDFTGRLSLKEAVGELVRLELLIANDTGFTHFGSLCTKRVFIILGGGTFGRFFPWPNARNQHIIYNAMSCYDCDWACHLPRRECLEQISHDQVRAMIPEILRLPPGAVLSHNVVRESVVYRCGWKRGGTVGAAISLAPGRTLAKANEGETG